MIATTADSVEVKQVVVGIALIRILYPILMIYKNIETKEILTISSLNNNGWFIILSLQSIKIFRFFLLRYTIITIIFVKWSINIKTKINQNKTNSYAILLVTRNIRGMPPTIIFWAKAAALKKIIQIEITRTLIVFIIILSCVIVYFYLWSIITELIKMTKKPQIITKRVPIRIRLMTLLIAPIPIILLYRLNQIGFILIG